MRWATYDSFVGGRGLSFPKIKSGDLIIYDFGELSYNDISGKRHVTTYCVFLSDPGTKTVSFCPPFNDIE
jgi:hypothetical protein